MTRSHTIAASFHQLWKEFASTSGKVRAKVSEKPIHHLRVTARRLIAVLDLVPELAESPEVAGARRQFKKVLQRTSPLRDVHVQLERIAHISKGDLQKFALSLEKREKQELAGIQKHIKRVGTRRFAEKIRAVQAQLNRLHESLAPQDFQDSIQRSLQSRVLKFQKWREKFRPSDEDALHKMRIALKKLRYTAEASQPVLGAVPGPVEQMKSFQQLIGNTRDVAILTAELEKWAARNGKKKVIAAALDQLKRERQAMMKKIIDRLPSFKNLAAVPRKYQTAQQRSASRVLKRHRKATDIVEKTIVMTPEEPTTQDGLTEPAEKRMAAGSRG